MQKYLSDQCMFANTFIDEGLLSNGARGHELQKLLKELKAGRVKNFVFVVSPDRMARNRKELIALKKLCDARGVPLISATDGEIL